MNFKYFVWMFGLILLISSVNGELSDGIIAYWTFDDNAIDFINTVGGV